ncbi:MAG: PEP/pyruvate-binding domain-containing protein [Halioglobus sp.]
MPAFSATVGPASADITTLKTSPRGPFSQVRWFCNDGEILPPRPYACREHGGGFQHGQWSEKTEQLRGEGYLIANLLAGISPTEYRDRSDFNDQFAQLLIEKFLMGIDQGWIFRRALYYRGAIQDEDERAGGRSLLLSLVGDRQWLGPRYVALRTAVALLPHGVGSPSISRVRQWSASLATEDPDFLPLRIKIHGTPAASDAESVREYARSGTRDDLQSRYEELAAEIDAIYQSQPIELVLAEWSQKPAVPAPLKALLRQTELEWQAAESASSRFALTASLLAGIRRALAATSSLNTRLDLLDVSMRVEREHYALAAALRVQLDTMSRQDLLRILRSSATASFGTGLINARLHNELDLEFGRVASASIDLLSYRELLNYAGRAPGWGVQALRQHFYPSMTKLAEIEPRALLFVQDQLRASPLLFYSTVLDILLRDVGRLSGIRHNLFGLEAGSGLHALNPGFARGVLHANPDIADHENFDRDGIYVLPETVAELPPVAGIITFGTGNPLSHVQLLARNLGIPNVSVSAAHADSLLQRDGRPVVLAVSAAGRVELRLDDSPAEEVVAGDEAAARITIEPDLDKLDLNFDQVRSLALLSAKDSGRIVGPKAAKLGELERQYPAAVARGLAIPFGVFKQVVLDQQHRSGAILFDWMKQSYRQLEAMPAGAAKDTAVETFRAELHQIIATTRLPASFISALRVSLENSFGAAFNMESIGVFVRSDTNVEDLPGFTGAGLNLTLPNVVGLENLLAAIPRVWASPFTRRAFSWRQSYMAKPEHVYTSILLLESVPADKSGVLVTANIDNGERDVLSVAVNEGLGGAVDGQAAESLRIAASGPGVKVLATATAPWRRVLVPAGGISKVPSSGSDTVLTAQNIRILQDFSSGLPSQFPSLVNEQGESVAADVEFGFVDDRLRLFQIRPFVESRAAESSQYLQRMDSEFLIDRVEPVDLLERPGL